ncbi:hypothetical protein A5844_001478 [Enterococcus sp. 10A9_DIV0425]|uniref:Uncharacterized protein n=1 Tax=Candidatus Enterococcus wittei TaxID=1987383 RepID=A0A242K1A4_9ENTE|nr:hypothetical protein A5844_001478 [Enterococcus sp. 10A9_DIV0425]
MSEENPQSYFNFKEVLKVHIYKEILKKDYFD